MAQQTVTYTLSDLSGKENASTVNFGLDGVDYAIDLTNDEAKEFRNSFVRYADAGRKTGRTSGSSRRSASGRAETGAIRKWAEEQGLTVPARGRIPNEIIRKYEAAKVVSTAKESVESEEPAAEPESAEQPAET